LAGGAASAGPPGAASAGRPPRPLSHFSPLSCDAPSPPSPLKCMFCMQVELVRYKFVMSVTMDPTGFYTPSGARPPPLLLPRYMGWEGGPCSPFFPLLPRYMWRDGGPCPPLSRPFPAFPSPASLYGVGGGPCNPPPAVERRFTALEHAVFTTIFIRHYSQKSVVGGGVVGWWLCVGVVVWRLSTHTTHSHGGQGWIRGYRLWWGVRVDEYMPLYVEKGVHGQDEQSPRGRQPRSP
jgi:hypothetical protein